MVALYVRVVVKTLKVRDILKIIRAEGWYHVRTTGSHKHYRHPTRPGTTTIPGHSSDELKPKTLKSILEQTGIRL